jgi:hypothetical protein
MKTNMQAAAVVFSALALSACGGSGEDTNTRQNKLLSTASTSVVSPQAAQAEYTDVVHRMYLAFFGRAADAHGLAFWVKAFSENNAPTTAPKHWSTPLSTAVNQDSFIRARMPRSLTRCI